MNNKIPIQLQNEEFRFVLLGMWDEYKFKDTKNLKRLGPKGKQEIMELKKEGWAGQGKAPFEKAWQTAGYKYNDQKLIEHLEADYNIGVIGGEGRLRILDIDNTALGEEISKRLDTFTVRTGSNGRHFYVICDYDINHVLVNELGEFRANKYQVVAPNMKHPSGNMYIVHNNTEIKEISKEDLLEIISPFIKPSYSDIQNNNAVAGVTSEIDTSRSGREWHEIIKLIKKGYSKTEVFTRMNAFSKWVESNSAYKEHTYNKALYLVTNEKEEADKIVQLEINKPLEVYNDAEVDSLTIADTNWLIKDLIPEGGLTIIGGKASSFKSTATLHFAYAITTGNKVFKRLDTKKANILYLNEENSWSIFKPIAIGVRKGLDIQPSESLFFSTFQDLRLDVPGGKEKLENAIVSKNINVIILDSLKRFISFEENAADKVNEFFVNILKPLMIKYKLSIIMLHHTKKDPVGANTYHKLDALRGSSDFVNIADSIVYFKRTVGAEFFSMEQVKNRAALEMKLRKIKVCREPDTNGGLDRIEFEDITDGETEDSSIEGNQAAQIILDKIKEINPGKFKPVEAEKWCEGIYKKTKVKEGIKILIDEGYLISLNSGRLVEVNKKHPELAVIVTNENTTQEENSTLN